MNEIADYSQFTLELPNNKRLLHEKGIRHYLNYCVEKFENGKLRIFYGYRNGSALIEPQTGRYPRNEGSDFQEIECDAVILVTSRVPNSALYDALRNRKSEWAANEIEAIFRIGDCHIPRQIPNAIFDGHRLGREFDSPHPQYPLPWIRERQIWGAPTYPVLGSHRPVVEIDGSGGTIAAE
jgi:dimethylamine/trimethylamine dehydrogenase